MQPTRLRKRAESGLDSLRVGTVYRIVGTWHVRTAGRLEPCSGLAAGAYAGQVYWLGTRYLFRDSDGTEYVVAPPSPVTDDLITARVYALRSL